MPPDAAAPPSRADTAPSSRNAVRGGILAAISTAPIAGGAAPQPTALASPGADQRAPPPPPRGLGASLRAAARRGLIAAKPLAAPLLHRLHMRMRTAVDDSGVAQALARLSERFEAEAAASRSGAADSARRLDAIDANDAVIPGRLDAIQRAILAVGDAVSPGRLDAIQRAILAVGDAVSPGRLDAIQRAILAVGDAVAADSARREATLQRRLDEAHQRLAVIEQGVAMLAARRPPVRVGDDFLVYTPDGVLLVPAEDLRFLTVIADGGVLETGTRRVLSALLRPGGVFLDVGANVGTMTLLGARAVGPAGRVVAVEPTPRIAALLRRSMAINDMVDRVAVADCAAGEREGEALLHLEDVMSHNTLFPGEGGPEGRGTVRVRVRAADELVPAGTPVDVAKIDAEGAELEVWRGMGRIVAESPALATVLEFGPSHLARVGVTPEAWLREVAEAPGFEPYMIDDMTGVCRPATLSALADVFSANILLLRPGAASRHPGLVLA